MAGAGPRDSPAVDGSRWRRGSLRLVRRPRGRPLRPTARRSATRAASGRLHASGAVGAGPARSSPPPTPYPAVGQLPRGTGTVRPTVGDAARARWSARPAMGRARRARRTARPAMEHARRSVRPVVGRTLRARWTARPAMGRAHRARRTARPVLGRASPPTGVAEAFGRIGVARPGRHRRASGLERPCGAGRFPAVHRADRPRRSAVAAATGLHRRHRRDATGVASSRSGGPCAPPGPRRSGPARLRRRGRHPGLAALCGIPRRPG